MVVEMLADGTATPGSGSDDRLHTNRVQHARRGCIDGGRHRRLNAVVEQQYFSGLDPRRQHTSGSAHAHLGTYGRRKCPTDRACQLQRSAKKPGPSQPLTQQPAGSALVPRPLDLAVDNGPANIDEVSILDTRRAGCLTTSARQTPVEM